MKLSNTIKRFVQDETGATAVEYGLIASLVVIASIGAFNSVADENTGLWATVEREVSDNMNE